MKYGLGAAPDWFIQKIRTFEPTMQAHAGKFARAYFEQFRKDEKHLIHGPGASDSFGMFRLENELPFWTDEEQPGVERYLFERYREHQDREFHRLLIHELLSVQ